MYLHVYKIYKQQNIYKGILLVNSKRHKTQLTQWTVITNYTYNY